jgi:hypothetical protein
MEMRGQLQASTALPLEMNPCTHSMGVWVGPRASQKDVGEEKNLISMPKFNTLLHKNAITASSWLRFVSLAKENLKCINRNAVIVTYNLSSILGKLFHLGNFSACNTTTYHD